MNDFEVFPLNFDERAADGTKIWQEEVMPIPIKTRPRFKCVHCQSYRATLPAVEKHERICWKNPDRFCPLCQNEGFYEIDPYGDAPFSMEQTVECHYCAKEDKELTASVKRSTK